MLTNGSHLLHSELDWSDLDLLCVVPNGIDMATVYGPSEDTLSSLLEKVLIN